MILQMASEELPEQGFGKLLGSYRLAAGLTQEELAALSGLSIRALGDIERNRTARPYRASVERLADALRLSGTTRQHFLDTGRGRSSPLPEAAQDGPPPRQVPNVPRQMPATVPYFTGRDSELSALTDLLCSRPAAAGAQVIVITGTAGVGKTALTLHWAHSAVHEFPDGHLYLNLRGFDPSGNPVTPGEAVRGLLASLGVPDERVPATPEGQAALYRTMLDGRRVLLVLDNARDATQVRPLLPGSPSCRVVVTSRNQLAGLLVTAGARLICLGVPSPAEASRMLALPLGDLRLDEDRGAVDALLALTARLPLALAIVAARGAARPDFPLASFAAGLTEARSRLDNLDAGDAEASIRSVFSWSYQSLDDLAARMFRLLALHPGPDITVRAAASLAGLPLGRARQALTELTTASMLAERVPGRYSFHDLLREYAAEQCRQTEDETEQRVATQRMLDHYLVTAYRADQLLSPIRRPLAIAPPATATMPEQHSGLDQAMAWLKAEHRVLLVSIGHAASAGFDAHAWQLAYAVATFFDRLGYWTELRTIQQMAVAAAERTGDLDGQAAAYRGLADACTQLGLSDDALPSLERAFDLYRQLGDLDGQARTELDLCRARGDRGEYGQALAHAQEALRLFKAAGHRVGQAHALNAIGWMHAQLRDYEQGLRRCHEALELFSDLGDRFGEGATWDSVGCAHHHLGRHAEAAACFQRAFGLFSELDARYSQAEILGHLGDAQRESGHPRAAADAYRRALAILTELDHPDTDDMNARLRQVSVSDTTHMEKNREPPL